VTSPIIEISMRPDLSHLRPFPNFIRALSFWRWRSSDAAPDEKEHNRSNSETIGAPSNPLRCERQSLAG
jgi:hypothetical protein